MKRVSNVLIETVYFFSNTVTYLIFKPCCSHRTEVRKTSFNLAYFLSPVFSTNLHVHYDLHTCIFQFSFQAYLERLTINIRWYIYQKIIFKKTHEPENEMLSILDNVATFSIVHAIRRVGGLVRKKSKNIIQGRSLLRSLYHNTMTIHTTSCLDRFNNHYSETTKHRILVVSRACNDVLSKIYGKVQQGNQVSCYPVQIHISLAP